MVTCAVTCTVTCGNMYGNVLFIIYVKQFCFKLEVPFISYRLPITVNFTNFDRALSGAV